MFQQHQNKFHAIHAIHARQDQKDSPNVVTSTLRVFLLDIYMLLDPFTTFSFCHSLYSNKLRCHPKKCFRTFISLYII